MGDTLIYSHPRTQSQKERARSYLNLGSGNKENGIEPHKIQNTFLGMEWANSIRE